MVDKFPPSILGGRTFQEVFVQDPKWVECVSETWTNNSTGWCKDFQLFVKTMLSNPIVKLEHENRCEQYVKTLLDEKIPSYLIKHVKPRATINV